VWSSSWPVIKDILLTAAGLGLIARAALSAHQSPELLTAGVVLTGGIASFKIGKVISAVIDGRSGSPPSTPPPSPPGSSSTPPAQEDTDD
jgi:hypothetical protein